MIRLKPIFSYQNRNHCNQYILPMRKKIAHSYNVKIHASGFSEPLESIFCLLLVVEAFSLQKNVKMLEEMVVAWQEVK